MKKMGVIYEGMFCSYIRIWWGDFCDIVWFFVFKDEWSVVSVGLEVCF